VPMVILPCQQRLPAASCQHRWPRSRKHSRRLGWAHRASHSLVHLYDLSAPHTCVGRPSRGNLMDVIILRQTRRRDRDIYNETETDDKDKDKDKDKEKDKDNDKDKKNRINKNPHPLVRRAALQRRKEWLSRSYSSPCAESDSCPVPRALLTGTDLRRTFHCWPLCPFSAVWFSGLSSGRLHVGAEPHGGKMGRMGNRHLGHHFCIFARFTRSKKLLSSERQKSKLSPAG
jgi:hypothetical protein